MASLFLSRIKKIRMAKSKKNKFKTKHRVPKFKKTKKLLKLNYGRSLELGNFFGSFEDYVISIIAITETKRKKSKKSKSKKWS